MSDVLKWAVGTFNTSFPGINWHPPQDFPTPCYSSATPALCAFMGKLWLMHRGGGTNPNIFYTYYAPTSTSAGEWTNTEPWLIPGKNAGTGPTMAVYGCQLYSAYLDDIGAISNFVSNLQTNDGSLNWSPVPSGIGISWIAPKFAAYGNALWCAYSDSGNKGLRFSKNSMDGNGWGNESTGPITSASPGFAAYHNKLWCVYRDEGSNLWVTTSTDGRSWEMPVLLGGQTSDSDPTLCYIPDLDILACVYGDSKGLQKFYFTYTLGRPDAWSYPIPIDGVARAPGAGAGMAYYQNKFFLAYRSA
ncbi:hypothetical protein GCM10011491_33110 [Brucella endophytica]|uniref:Uncharacterized protein n=1 Tax=Brucella endophytica TaxID=1963359 RepID=A0A916SLK9_9HYPH|nr:hypothetical protein [Brucella endophytica]GGB02369.1 hypothetical protein GCM10011491_33110 [Brucella endophytica]